MSKEVEEKDTWRCVECKLDLATDEVKKHLRERHGLTHFSGTRQMDLHLDCARSYYSVYTYKIGGVELTRSIRRKRDIFNRLARK